jgi:hypothetical protein
MYPRVPQGFTLVIVAISFSVNVYEHTGDSLTIRKLAKYNIVKRLF